MRVDRALDKLRGQLTRLGISSTSAALTSVLASQAVIAAPASLAASITQAALVTGSGGALVSLFQFMAISKSQVAVAGALLIGGGTTVALQHEARADLQQEIRVLSVENARMSADAQRESDHDSEALAAKNRLASAGEDLPRLRKEVGEFRARALALTAARAAAAKSKSAATVPASQIQDGARSDRQPTPSPEKSYAEEKTGRGSC